MTAALALTPPLTWGEEPRKSTTARLPRMRIDGAILTGFIRDAVIVQTIDEGVVAVGDVADGVAQEFFRVILDESGVARILSKPYFRDRFADSLLAFFAGRDLGQEIALALLGRPDVGQNQAQDLVVDSSLAHELERRQDQAFLEDFGGQGHAARASFRRRPNGGRGWRRKKPNACRMKTGAMQVMSGRCVPPR